ncbi:MAG: flagellar biosynthesis protein FliW [Candidatus Dactylopiibacterium carminicum]|uniref:flagellar assembly protein FliW n=1 Tax=Candidatus Dactylopiibacterium carminicum TaxID=857335 RepID=UPI000BD302CF|nr:flagellar assembly protein FliW [Candidatus Dactylopiibacterium carminicum]PAT00565.1 MAG: flagellar biosynthesis protein FliW [Candidatus Dactylopiibacterium carminicum]
MKIDSPRFGTLEVESNKLIEFPLGLPGLENCRTFSMLEMESAKQVVAVLQSMDDPDVAFSVTTPDLLGLHYEFDLTEDEERLLGVSKVEDLAVLLILRAGEKDGESVHANLVAPLVINMEGRKGLQKVMHAWGVS